MSTRIRMPRVRLAIVTAAFLLAFLGLVSTAAAQPPMTGVYNVPGDYPTLAAAINDLNLRGVGAGGAVVFMQPGNPQTAPAGGYVIGGSGSLLLTTTGSGNPVEIHGQGNTITAYNPQAAGALNDAIFKIVGADYVMIEGFVMQENPANATTTPASNNMTEWGVALLYVGTTDGAQSNTILQNQISLNRGYTNTWGVYSNVRHSATAPTTLADITAASGANSFNWVRGNNISNVNMGVAFIGSGTAANQDIGNTVGGSIPAQGNTITNWGGAAAASSYVSNSGTSYGIFMNHQRDDQVVYNTLTSAAVSGTSVTFRGIFKAYTTTVPTGSFTSRIISNTVTMTSGFTSGTFEAIRSQDMTALSTATIHIADNTILNCAVTGAASSSTIVGIVNTSAPGTLNLTGNMIRGTTSTATTGGFTGVSNTGAVVTAINMNNNQIGNAAGGAVAFSAATSGAVTGITSTGGASTCALSMTGNDIRGITHAVAGTSAHTYIINSAATLSQNISSNTFTNLNVNTTGSATFISNNVALPAGGSVTANGNSIVTAYNKGGAGGTVTLYLTTTAPSSVAGTTKSEQNNDFSNITLTGSTTMAGWTDLEGATGGGSNKTIANNTFTNWTCGSGAVTGIQTNYAGNGTTISGNTIAGVTGTGAITGISLGSSSGGAAHTVSANAISGLSSSGISGAVLGITGGSSSIATLNVTGNTIGGFSNTNTTAAVSGIVISAGATVNVTKNKVYELAANGASILAGSVNGILMSAGATLNVANNLVGDLRAPTANVGDAIRGLSITSTATGSTYNLYYNTVHLNAASTGATFGTSGLYHTTNATATNAALNLRDNIVVNLSTPNGTGVTAAYRRSSTALTNYASGSNNNLFYGGAPAANRLVFHDGTNSDQTLAAFKARVTPRETLSLTESTPFLSVAGAGPTFLHIDPLAPTQVEGAGQVIGTVGDDFDGNPRDPSTPDIGADEGIFTLADLSGPAISYAPLGNDTGLATRYAGGIVITDPSNVDVSGSTGPRLYYRRSGDANAFNDNTSGSDGWKWVPANGALTPFDFTLDYAKLFGPVALGTVIEYFVVAQDLAAVPNVAINSGTFAAPPASVVLTPAAAPIGGPIRSYVIVAMPLNGDYVVSSILFGEVTGVNLGFERKVERVVRTVLEPEEQQPQVSGDKSSEEVFLADRLNWKAVEREVEEITWVPLDDGRAYNGPLYVKRAQNPDLPPHALSGVYATITAAVADLNARGVSGPVRFLLADATYPSETFPITVNIASAYLPTATNTVTFKPDAGVSTTVSGASASSALFKIFGTNYIAIDGSNAVAGSSRDLTLENTSATGPNVVWFGSSGTTPIVGGALKNCLVRNGVSTSSAVVISDGTTAGNAGYFSNLEVSNNQIEKAYIGVYANGGTTPAGGAGLTYADNTLSTSGANQLRLAGLYMQGVNGATVSGNVIGNFETATAENDVGIWLATGTTNALVSGNTVTSLAYTGTSGNAPIGINVTSGAAGANVDVKQNTVTSLSTTGSAPVRGIASSGTGTADVVIQRNLVSGVANNNTGTYGAYGIDIAGGNNHVVRNNFVSDVKFNMQGGGAFSTTFGVFGIRVGSGTGHVVAANSVNLFGALPGTANSNLLTAALGVVGTTSTGCDIRSNLLANTISGGTTSLAHVAAFLPVGGSPAMNLTWNNNAYYSGPTTASQGIAQVGTSAGAGFYLAGNFDPANTTPATNLRAYTSTLSAAGANDNASLANTAAAPYQANTDLHVRTDMMSPVSNAGVTVAGVGEDFDGDPRAPTPDIGADEFTIYTLNVVTVGSGNVTVNPAQTAYPSGATVTLTPVPADACQAFTGWSGDAMGDANPLTVVMDGNKNITATFAPATYTITAMAGAGGAISPTGDVPVACGADQGFTIAPDACFDVADVLVDGVSVGAVLSYAFTGVAANHTIEALFVAKTYTITASTGPGGTIDPSGAVVVGCGADQTFNIQPAPCFDVAYVLVDGVSVGPVLSYAFTGVSANHTIEAFFAARSYTITASAGAGGAISPSGAVTVACSGSQTFTITPDVGQNIADVLVDDVSVGAVASYTFTGVSANHTIAASFTTADFVIVASAGAGGSISPSGNVAVAYGADQTFTITPDGCYQVMDVLVDGVSVGAVASYTFTAVNASHTIQALFALKSYTISASAGPGGMISPNGALVVPCGSDLTFTITPNPGQGVLDVLVDNISVGPVLTYTFTNVTANHSIQVAFFDTQCPVVTVLDPNGGEELIIDVTADLTWTAIDNLGVTCVDLLLSRSGLAGPFETLATCIPNSGLYSWIVTGAVTDHALLKVVAHDAAGNACEDLSDAEFRIIEEPVSVMLSRFEASPVQLGVEIRWQLSGVLQFASTELGRSDAESGPYTRLEQDVRLIDGDYVAVDDTVEMGRTYWYRLRGLTRSGQTISFEPVSTKAGVPIVEFALKISGANPARDMSRIGFAVPRPSHVRVTVVDLQGRRVATLADGVFNVGRHEVAWDGNGEKGRMASGVYMIRLEAPGANLIQRVTFVH